MAELRYPSARPNDALRMFVTNQVRSFVMLIDPLPIRCVIFNQLQVLLENVNQTNKHNHARPLISGRAFSKDLRTIAALSTFAAMASRTIFLREEETWPERLTDRLQVCLFVC
jgi:hypothetical protein